MAFLKKDQIINAQDLQSIKISVSEWGGDVLLVEPSADEIIDLAGIAQDSNDIKQSVEFQYRLLALTICDENKNRLFSEANIRELGKKSKKIIDRLLKASMELCKLTEESQEDVTKNSEKTQYDGLSIA